MDQIGQQFGHYRLTQLLGQGAFANVYLAEHVHLNTNAAVKLLHTHIAPEVSKEFRREAQIVSTLTHPHIVRVLDFGVEDLIPFLVMDYAPHGTIRLRHPQNTRLPLATVSMYTQQIASALQYAHERKVIHRDVKPENILISQQDTLLLSDFGISQIAQSSRSTDLNQISGTISYMAPEQLQGKLRIESDQYALGIVVYEWICGQRPFQGSFVELYSQHNFVPPPSFSEKGIEVPAQVENVVRKALEKEPQQRFSSILQFSQALEQAIQEAPPAAYSSIPTYVTPVTVESTQAFSTFLTPIQAINVGNTPAAKPALALQAAEEAHITAPQTQQPSSNATTQRISRRTILLGLAGGILVSGGSALALTNGKIFAGLSSTALTGAGSATGNTTPTKAATKEPGMVLVTHKDRWFWAVGWSPDGKYVAATGENTAVQIWEANTNKRVSVYNGHTHNSKDDSVIDLAWSPDSTRIVSVGDLEGQTPELHVWNVRTGRLISTYSGHNPRPGHTNIVDNASWSPDGSKIVTSGVYDKTAQIWNAATGENILTYRKHQYDVAKVRWSPDGKYIASASAGIAVGSGSGGDAQVWDLQGNTIATYTEHENGVDDLTWSPDSKYIASVGNGGSSLHIWNAATGTPSHKYDGSRHVRWSGDGKYIATLGLYKKSSDTYQDDVVVINATTGQIAYTFKKQLGQINGLSWSPDSRYIASCSGSNQTEESTVMVWQAQIF